MSFIYQKMQVVVDTFFNSSLERFDFSENNYILR